MSSRDVTVRSEIPTHGSDSRFHGRRMLHAQAALPTSASGSSALAVLGTAAHAPRHRRPTLNLPDVPRTHEEEESAGDADQCDFHDHRNACKA